MRIHEKSRWQVAELSVSLKILWTVPLNLWSTSSSNENSEDKEIEQSAKIDLVDKLSVCSGRKEKPKDLDTGVDGNKQFHDDTQDFEVSGGFDEDQESQEIVGKKNLYMILSRLLNI
ncbi:hypothetical protein ElyMa_000394500 [Elysia marginata]|uniref:CTNNB1 binding N-teminal domain-containing protein n=1 Tax=Elysia marginata TaxID=1093978 RepID=A0AAV4FJ01_9GAST|nr:hypothetical protein ElyMa_000394500 [Elysia marginata]